MLFPLHCYKQTFLDIVGKVKNWFIGLKLDTFNPLVTTPIIFNKVDPNIYGDAGAYFYRGFMRVYLNKDMMGSLGVTPENYKGYRVFVCNKTKDCTDFTLMIVKDEYASSFNFSHCVEVPLQERKENRTQFKITLKGRSWADHHPTRTRYVFEYAEKVNFGEDEYVILNIQPYSRDKEYI